MRFQSAKVRRFGPDTYSSQLVYDVAGNVIPDTCRVEVNFRYAPDRDEDAAEAHVREVFADAVATGGTLTVVDNAGGALPGLAEPAAAAFVAAVGRPARAKLGWTDVARFAAFGIPVKKFRR